MLRPRFRLRTLMVLVAVAGLAIGVDGMRRRRSYHRAQAAGYAEWEGKYAVVIGRKEARAEVERRNVAEIEAEIATLKDDHFAEVRDNYRWSVEIGRRLAAHEELDLVDCRLRRDEYGRLRRLHEYAASHPWLRIEAEPFRR